MYAQTISVFGQGAERPHLGPPVCPRDSLGGISLGLV